MAFCRVEEACLESDLGDVTGPRTLARRPACRGPILARTGARGCVGVKCSTHKQVRSIGWLTRQSMAKQVPKPNKAAAVCE